MSRPEITWLMVNQYASHHTAASPRINSVCPSIFPHCLVPLTQHDRSHFRWEAVRRWSYSLGLQHPEGVHSSSGYAITRSHGLCNYLTKLILFLVLRLRGGGYPQYILIKAAELNNDNESIETKFYPLYNKILNY